MINYFYNIIVKSDPCDLLSDVLTLIRKEFYISREKQRAKLTQNSDDDTLFYEYSLEKDHPLKWVVSDESSILSESKPIGDGRYCVNYYDESGVYKKITFSKLHTLLKVEYFNTTAMTKSSCVIEPRKYSGGLCLLYSTSSDFQPVILYSMPDVTDEYVYSKVQCEFTDYTVVAHTNEGVVKYLSEEQLSNFEDFIDRMTALKLTDTAPESFIDEDDAQLARKLNPKDFNLKRNLCETVDISQAEQFSFDLSTDLDVSFCEKLDSSEEEQYQEVDIDATLQAFLEQEENPQAFADVNDVCDACDAVESCAEEFSSCDDTTNDFDKATLPQPDTVIESANNKYSYFGALDSDGNRIGFGRTLTKDGRTAYEGEYLNNKRNGVGAYYYKDGTLCYYGDWVDNRREGFGVAVSSFDSSVHIGNFVANKPFGDGVRVDSTGTPVLVTKTLSDGTVVEITFENDEMIVSKFDRDSNLISKEAQKLK